MFKQVVFHGHLNERTGYGVHATNFVRELGKIVPLVVNEVGVPGAVHISLLDTVSASNQTTALPAPSILYNVWESTEQPVEFIEKLQLYDQLWVPSEWQKSVSIAQGIPEEFIKVVPEGVDPSIYKPLPESTVNPHIFSFLHVGQWQPRKSTLEICQAFLKAFPNEKNVRLYLSTDTLFPSDSFKSTEERLEAYGIKDSRIIPIHFEDRESYVRRLQQAQCFVTCARSEGWNLPLIEAMACGVVSIASDFGGSTEYASEAHVVRISELKKPHGIYGGWDVPGQWAEPDYDHLAEIMQHIYNNYTECKKKALEVSEKIRKDFSWAAAAQKAKKVLNDLHYKAKPVKTAEDDIKEYAKKHGYEVTLVKKKKAIFCIDSHPSDQDRIDTLIETIRQVRQFGFPVLVSAHLPLPQHVAELCDYVIYDRNDTVSPPDDMPVYSRRKEDGTMEYIHSRIPCHGLAGLKNARNSLDFCMGKWDWIYLMNSDVELDLNLWMEKVNASTKDLIVCPWEGAPETLGGQIIAGKGEVLDKLLPRLETWQEFAEVFQEDRFCSERGYYKIAKDNIGLQNIEFLNLPLGNRFDQVDHEVWPDDVFMTNFIEGPTLHINGLSRREYDVEFISPVSKLNCYGLKQKPGMWSKPKVKYYQDWTVKASLNGELKYEHKINLKGKRVLISLGSKALGDTIAWMPYIEEFRKKHDCQIVCSGWWQEIFDYPFEFVKPGSEVAGIYASYEVGCFDDQLDKNVQNWRTSPLQKVAADTLGLDYEPLKAKFKFKKRGNGHASKYICFSEFSTMQSKLWNRPGAWQKVIDYLVGKGYECVSISNEPSQLNNVTKHNGQSIQNTLSDIAGADFYVGLNHGPAWIAYALGIPTILITGVSEAWNDFPTPYRIAINNEVCGIGCFNDPSLKIDRGWHWCPRGRDYACTREITEEMVYSTIERLMDDKLVREDLNDAIKTWNKSEGDKQKHQGIDGLGEAAEAGGGDSVVQCAQI